MRLEWVRGLLAYERLGPTCSTVLKAVAVRRIAIWIDLLQVVIALVSLWRAKVIVAQHCEYLAGGGGFIIPIPHLEVVSSQ